MNETTPLLKFLTLISENCSTRTGSRVRFPSDKTHNDSTHTPSRNETSMNEFIHKHGARSGLTFTMPSFSCTNQNPMNSTIISTGSHSHSPIKPVHDMSGHGHGKQSYPSSVLKTTLNACQCGYKGTATDTDRNNNNSSTILHDYDSLTEKQKTANTNTNANASGSNTGLKSRSRAVQVVDNIKREIMFRSKPSSSEENLTRNGIDMNMASVLPTLHENLHGTVQTLLEEQIVTITSRLIRNTILRVAEKKKKNTKHNNNNNKKNGKAAKEKNGNGLPSKQSARMMNSTDPDAPDCKPFFVSELEDHESVAKSFLNMSIHANHKIPSKSDSEKKFSSEEEDQKLVAASLKESSQSYNSNSKNDTRNGKGKFSSEEEDQRLVAESLQEKEPKKQYESGPNHSSPTKSTNSKDQEAPTTTTTTTDEDEEESIKNKNEFGHIASIKSIHESSPSLQSIIAAKRVIPSSRRIQSSVTSCSTSFEIIKDEKEEEVNVNVNVNVNEGDKNSASVALTMNSTVIVKLGKDDYMIDFETTGTVEGNFNESKLVELKLSLDIQVLFEAMIKEINKAIKEYVAQNKPRIKKAQRRSGIVCEPPMPAITTGNNINTSNGIGLGNGFRSMVDPSDRLRVAQTLSEMESRQAMAGIGANAGTGAPLSMPPLDSASATLNMNGNSSSQLGSPTQRRLNLKRDRPFMDGDMGVMGNIGMMNGMGSALGEPPIHKQRRSGQMFQSESMVDVRMAEEEELLRIHGLNGMNAMQGRQQRPSMVGMKRDAMFMSNQNESKGSIGGDPMRGHSSGSVYNGALQNNRMEQLRRESNSMAAAAEAVRRADAIDAENSLQSLRGLVGVGAPQQSEIEAALGMARRSSYGQTSMSGITAAGGIDSSFNNYGGRNSFSSVGNGGGLGSLSRTELENMIMRNNNGPHNPMFSAAEAVRLAEFETAMARKSRTDSMAEAAAAVRLAELESQMKMENAMNQHSGRSKDSMAVAAEAVRRSEIENAMMRGGRAGDGLSSAAESRRGELEAERRRRSSLTEAMRLVEMDTRRRSSTGASMSAAAEAVRLAEMEAFGNQRRQSYAAATESHLNNNEFESLNSFMRRSSGPNGSMAQAAEAVRMAELEQMLEQSRWKERRRSGAGVGMASAADAVRAELENEYALSRQIREGGHAGSSIGIGGVIGAGGNDAGLNFGSMQMTQAPMRNTNGRRVSFGPNAMRDHVRNFQRM